MGTGPGQVLPETARRGDDRQTFGYRDGSRSTQKRPDLLDENRAVMVSFK